MKTHPEHFNQLDLIITERIRQSLANTARKIHELQTQIPEKGHKDFEDGNGWKMDWDFKEDHMKMLEDLELFTEIFCDFNGSHLFDFGGIMEEFKIQYSENKRRNETALHEQLELSLENL